MERLGAKLGAGGNWDECGAVVASAGETLLARPTLYMNRSGWAIACLADHYALTPEHCLVVYDDVALPLGRVRLRAFGSPGGHRGLESIVENLESESVPRLRLGIRPPAPAELPTDLSEFVLAPFAVEELDEVERLIERGVAAAASWCSDGIEATMNRFNG